MPEENAEGLIYEAIANIMADVGAIEKKHQGTLQYPSRSIEDFYNELHPLVAKHRVFTIPRVLESKENEVTTHDGKVGVRVVLRVAYDLIASDGSVVTAITQGEANDWGDKASQKAMAHAHKKALEQIFMLATHEPGDNPPEERQPARGRRREERKPQKREEPKPKKPANPLDDAKQDLRKTVHDIRAACENKKLPDDDWIKKVISHKLGKGQIDTVEEVDAVKASVQSMKYDLPDAEEIPF